MTESFLDDFGVLSLGYQEGSMGVPQVVERPGEANGPWRVVDAGNFAGLQGEGDWWAIGVSETLVGEIAYDS